MLSIISLSKKKTILFYEICDFWQNEYKKSNKKQKKVKNNQGGNMPVLRIHKTKNYTVMSNFHLREKEMSLKAKGLLSIMLSLPDDWDYSIAGLVSICKEDKTAIRNALKELKDFGYLKVTKLPPNKEEGRNQFTYVYDIFESPQDTKDLGIGFLYLDNLDLENQTQLNTKELNTNKLNKVSKKESEKLKPEKRAKENVISFNQLIENYTENQQLRDELKEHLKVRKNKKAALTNRAIELSLKKLDDLAVNDAEKIQMVQNAIMSGWTTFYPLKADEKQKMGSNPSYDMERYKKSGDVFESMDEDNFNGNSYDVLSEFKISNPRKRREIIDIEVTND